MFFKKKAKKNLYSEEAVKFIIKRILQETIDRTNLFILLNYKFKNIIDDKVISELYTQINKNEKEIDKREIEYWMEVLNKRIYEED